KNPLPKIQQTTCTEHLAQPAIAGQKSRRVPASEPLSGIPMQYIGQEKRRNMGQSRPFWAETEAGRVFYDQ
ncbi:MAG TPA: hypothetical protein PK971_11615, partial [Saprospiraceae bacterium]|nr:hypothetical protein [Saprospiraceae bacterium]HND88971.1 hypothetical protein [Saprospiraceae bacterium]